jgi:hypothetical protein
MIGLFIGEVRLDFGAAPTGNPLIVKNVHCSGQIRRIVEGFTEMFASAGHFFSQFCHKFQSHPTEMLPVTFIVGC